MPTQHEKVIASMIHGFAQIIETFGMDEDAMENAGTAVVEIKNISDSRGEYLAIVLEDAEGNEQRFTMEPRDA